MEPEEQAPTAEPEPLTGQLWLPMPQFLMSMGPSGHPSFQQPWQLVDIEPEDDRYRMRVPMPAPAPLKPNGESRPRGQYL